MLSVLLSIPKGLLEPSRCNKAICAITKPAIAKGRIKCKLKNLFKVALSIEKPPHNHSTIAGPAKGIAEKKISNNGSSPKTHLTPWKNIT